MEARACKQCKKKTKSYYLVSPKTGRCSEVVLCDQCYEDQVRRAIFDRALDNDAKQLACTNWSHFMSRRHSQEDEVFLPPEEITETANDAYQSGMEAAADDLAAATDEEEAT